MNPATALGPAIGRPGPSSFAATDATGRTTSPAGDSFYAALGNAFNPAFERALAGPRSLQGKAGAEGHPEQPRNGLRPIEAERRKAKEELEASLAGAWAVAPAPMQGAEHECPPDRPLLRTTPAAMDCPPDALTFAGLTAEQTLAAPPTFGSTGGDRKEGESIRGEFVNVSNTKPAVVETPDAHSSVDSRNELAAAGQPALEASRSAGGGDVIEAGRPSSEPDSPFPFAQSQAMQDSPTHAGEGSAPLAKMPVEGDTNSRGIAGAKLQEQMKNTIKPDEIAASAGQIMPGSQAVLLRPARLDTRRDARRTPLESLRATPLAGAAGLDGSSLPTAGTGLSPAQAELPARLSPVAQMSKVISREVQIFRRTADESMEVVLTPDQNTQISLRLQWREGKVEILAQCHQGDFLALSTEWPQLQAALGHQGVRLAHLTQPAHSEFAAFFSSAGFSQTPSGGQQQPSSLGVLDKLGSATPNKPVRKRGVTPAVRPRHLLESWA